MDSDEIYVDSKVIVPFDNLSFEIACFMGFIGGFNEGDSHYIPIDNTKKWLKNEWPGLLTDQVLKLINNIKKDCRAYRISKEYESRIELDKKHLSEDCPQIGTPEEKRRKCFCLENVT